MDERLEIKYLHKSEVEHLRFVVIFDHIPLCVCDINRYQITGHTRVLA